MTSWLSRQFDRYGIATTVNIDDVPPWSSLPPADMVSADDVDTELLMRFVANGYRFLLTTTDLTKHPFNLATPVESQSGVYLFELAPPAQGYV